eukprot:gnl/TRDRNA2_/TRDRNA2_173409_c2_seq1.p1 gnl/TRDRNA2_/TRDRNA2_173409_c2~~gnl/TRDRNA2_/TRDRNA2_173409_c2_seq1.p1  ORF type:complete len:370 (+),score=75.40 gnl/TRDRNA2_/TRDRNA2_173409_c2_seq1:324-1433(+)
MRTLHAIARRVSVIKRRRNATSSDSSSSTTRANKARMKPEQYRSPTLRAQVAIARCSARRAKKGEGDIELFQESDEEDVDDDLEDDEEDEDEEDSVDEEEDQENGKGKALAEGVEARAGTNSAGRRRRKNVCGAKCICKKALSGICNAVGSTCSGPVNAASNTVNGIENAVNKLKKLSDSALSLYKKLLDEVSKAIKFVDEALELLGESAKYLIGVGFKAEMSVGESVGLKVAGSILKCNGCSNKERMQAVKSFKPSDFLDTSLIQSGSQAGGNETSSNAAADAMAVLSELATEVGGVEELSFDLNLKASIPELASTLFQKIIAPSFNALKEKAEKKTEHGQELQEPTQQLMEGCSKDQVLSEGCRLLV